MHQRLIIVNKEYIVNERRWYGRASFGGNSFDSVHLIPLQGLFQRFSGDSVHLRSLL